MTEIERKEIEKKTHPITAIIVIVFAFIFNSIIMGKYFK